LFITRQHNTRRYGKKEKYIKETIESHTHKKSKRKNIPTAELQDFVLRLWKFNLHNFYNVGINIQEIRVPEKDV